MPPTLSMSYIVSQSHARVPRIELEELWKIPATQDSSSFLQVQNKR